MAGLTTRAPPPPLTIRSVRTFAVEAPMTHPLGTSAAIVDRAPLLLVELETEEGITGRSYLFCYRRSVPRAIDAVLRDAVALVAGEPAAPLDVARKLTRRFALVGVASLVRMALSALDVALWDALAVAAGLPLATFLGASPRPIPAYNSSGLGLMAPEAAADEAEQLLAGGFRSVKLRLGHPTLAQDLAVTRAVRRRLPDEIELPVDYNQALTVAEAIRRGRALEAEGIAWLEEPIRHDDYAGNAAVARALTVPVQIGENFGGPEAMIEALGAGACDHVMPDAARIGGRDRLAPGGRHRRGAPDRDVLAPAARAQRAPARGHADLPLARVRRLGRRRPRGAALDRRRLRPRPGAPRHRARLPGGRGRGAVAGPLTRAPTASAGLLRARGTTASLGSLARTARGPPGGDGSTGAWRRSGRPLVIPTMRTGEAIDGMAGLEEHRAALTGHCYRMLGVGRGRRRRRAGDAGARVAGPRPVRRALLAAHLALPDRHQRVPRRAGRARPPGAPGRRRRRPARWRIRSGTHERTHWLEPVPDATALPRDADPAERAMLRQSIRLAFVAALQHLPPRQRAALLLTEVLGWSAAEVAEALDTSAAAVNSALQRARATLARHDLGDPAPLCESQARLLDRYVDAFDRYDVDALAALLREDVTFSMPPHTLWLRGPAAVRGWLLGRGCGCRGSRLLPTAACGSPAFGQYRPDPRGGHQPWALVVLELAGDRIASWTSFLDTETLFPRFGLPASLSG